MSGIFSAVDLSKLPSPAVIDGLNYDAIYNDIQAQYITLYNTAYPDAPIALPLAQHDPVAKLLQTVAYRELWLRARVNSAAKAVMLAHAVGSDLDNIVAREPYAVTRLVIVPANPNTVPPTPAVYETDEDLRRRAILAPHRYSVAGPEGAYLYHALSAHADVLDVSATSPTPGHVLLTVLGRNTSGIPTNPVLNAVNAACNASDVRPLTDIVTVQAATIVDYVVHADITFYRGPDQAVILAAANARIAEHVAAKRRLGLDITRAGIIAALHVEGVQNIDVNFPSQDIVISQTQASNCTEIIISNAGVDN